MEQRVVLRVAAGRTTAELAAQLGIDAMTVEWHVSRACRKLGVRSREGLAALFAGDIAEQLGEAVE
jgi:DNA-binding CsgD family transcriptional regulator